MAPPLPVPAAAARVSETLHHPTARTLTTLLAGMAPDGPMAEKCYMRIEGGGVCMQPVCTLTAPNVEQELVPACLFHHSKWRQPPKAWGWPEGKAGKQKRLDNWKGLLEGDGLPPWEEVKKRKTKKNAVTTQRERHQGQQQEAEQLAAGEQRAEQPTAEEAAEQAVGAQEQEQAAEQQQQKQAAEQQQLAVEQQRAEQEQQQQREQAAEQLAERQQRAEHEQQQQQQQAAERVAGSGG